MNFQNKNGRNDYNNAGAKFSQIAEQALLWEKRRDKLKNLRRIPDEFYQQAKLLRDEIDKARRDISRKFYGLQEQYDKLSQWVDLENLQARTEKRARPMRSRKETDYRTLAKLVHPDAGGTEEAMQALNRLAGR
jgi:hypothetical protein